VHNGKVLLAEDEEQVRTLITRLLEKRGYEVLAAENGRAALELAGDGAQDVVLLITDMIMPEMGGAALVHALRARRPDLPVLCMTGYTREEVNSSDQLPDAAFIEKPFTPALFLDQVDQLAGTA
jgi:two-component system cell cycle sensor histidine kinase/response regulator CckA